MNGTGPTPAEQHLGDRLAALVDGELGHDARDRVLAHLATCHKCKAEADAQRRLKSVFAQSAPPPLSEGLLARLQGLPAEPGGGGSPQGPFGGQPADSVFGALTPSAEHSRARRGEAFGYVPGGSHAAALPGAGGGFRIHEVGRAEAERSPWRGRRFAFAAASAVSFAAIALGGAVPVDVSGETTSRGQNGGNKVSPARTVPGTGVATGAAQGGTTTVRASEGDRRRGGRADSGPAAAVAPTAPPAVIGRTPPFTASILMYDSAALPPLIRPAAPTLQLASASVLPPTVTPQHTAAAPAAPATAAASGPRTSPLTPLR